MVDRKAFQLGAADLAVEANFLRTLDHPRIVKLLGVAPVSVGVDLSVNVNSDTHTTPSTPSSEPDFFIVIERLHGTLENKIEQWKEEEEEAKKKKKNVANNILYRRSHEYREKRREALRQRLHVAVQIAEAIAFLHHNHIVYRDLKPDNVGFDADGNVKIFDFGLAKELKSENKLETGKYKMTGNTGSRRYMAPEVALERPYDASVDIFSFGILLWELCALEKPFYGFSANKHMVQVVQNHERPRLDTSLPSSSSSSILSIFPLNLQWLLKKCWSTDPDTRPSIETIQEVLRDIMEGKTCIPEKKRQEGEGEGEEKVVVEVGNEHQQHKPLLSTILPKSSQSSSPRRSSPMKRGNPRQLKKHPSFDVPTGGFASLNPLRGGSSTTTTTTTTGALGVGGTVKKGRAKTWGFSRRQRSTGTKD